MTSRLGRFLIISLLLLTLLIRSPMLIFFDALLLLAVGTTALWGRYCLAGVSYARRFGTQRLFCGEETDFWVEIVNAKPLPLAWLKADDEFPAALTLQRVQLSPSSDPHHLTLSNLFTLRWYERVRRHYRLAASRRGAFDFGPALISSGDIFGFRIRSLSIEDRQTILVYPKIVPLDKLGLRAARPLGDFRADRRIVEDPLRLAGARDYRPGDNLRHIHWKATARRGALQTKTFDPSASQHLIVFVNNQTRERAYEGIVGDHFETAMVIAASVAHAGLEARHPVGLFTNGSVRESRHRVRLHASRHPAQLIRILETLAQLTYFTLMPFDNLLRLEAGSLPYGATVLAVSPFVAESILSALLDLRAAGHPAALIALGDPPARPRPPEIPVYFVKENWTNL